MNTLEPAALLQMLRDPNQESGDIARAIGVSREEAGRAARVALCLNRAKAEELLGLPPVLAVPLLEAAATAGRQDVVAAAAVHPQRELSKAGKRILYQLKLKGAPVPELPRARPAAAPPPPEPALPCYASGVDGAGERVFWVARNLPGKGVEVAQAAVSDEKGLIELLVGQVGRKEYRALAKDLLDRGRDMGVTEIDRTEALSAVSAAAAQNASTGTRLPESASGWLARLGPLPPPADPATVEPALPEEEERAALEASASLHQLPLVSGWLADEEALRALAGRLDEISVSTLYLDEAQRAQASSSAIDDALARYLDEPRRARWAARLFTTAAHLRRLGEPRTAQVAAAAARALQAAPGGEEAARIPFARLLVVKALPDPGSAPPPRFGPRDQGSLILSPVGGPR